MDETNKKNLDLLAELTLLRKKVADLEQAEVKHKQTEDEMYQSRQMLQLILDTIPVRVFWKDRNFNYLGCNKPFARDAGLDNPDQIVGRDDFSLGWREIAKIYRDDDRLVMDRDTPKLQFEEPQTTPDGGKLWLRTSKVPLHDRGGNVIGVLGMYEDITEKKRSEEELRYERNLLRTLIDNLPDNIYVKDRDCRKTVANPSDVRLMGLSSEAQALGKNDFDVYPKEVAEGFFADDQKVIQGGQRVLREEFLLDEKGEKKWLYTWKLPLRSEEGTIVGLVGIGRDITQRKRAEEALEHERSLLRTVISNIPDLFYFKDAEGRYVLNNLAHLRSLGAEHQEDVLGKTTFDFNPAELAKHYSDSEMHIVQTGEPLLEMEELALHKDTGEERWHLTSKIPLKDHDGNVTGIIGISRDITERKHIEAERERLIEQLKRALADVKTLSGLVPICANCKKIRDDKGYWTQLEAYIQERTPAHFSHGICPECAKKLYPEYYSTHE